ncbi:hypothetical protein PEDI_49620 [Persicobacter diffluens]|uniref:Uncharacterized protein n=1 Tax=Persicobacter diffluens TaxID=981 RepID=A0AAN4W4H9_9BACT|nr:hypothetical protein PEDI_49620 [Persicobacter diffluens]
MSRGLRFVLVEIWASLLTPHSSVSLEKTQNWKNSFIFPALQLNEDLSLNNTG